MALKNWEYPKKLATKMVGIVDNSGKHPGSISGDKLFVTHRWPKTYRGKHPPYGTNHERMLAHKK